MPPPEFLTELRSASVVDAAISGRTVKGFAAVYESPWNDRLTEAMGYVEKVARGAFRKALASSGSIPLLWQHEKRDMLATTGGGTMRLRDEPTGLAFEADLPNTQLGNDVLEHIRRGDVRGMSYGIESLRSDSEVDWTTMPPTRIVKGAQRLIDITLTYEPNYEAATVELRSAGFVALPLQEIALGAEAQAGEAAGEVSSLEAKLHKRESDLRLAILEKGGVL